MTGLSVAFSSRKVSPILLCTTSVNGDEGTVDRKASLAFELITVWYAWLEPSVWVANAGDCERRVEDVVDNFGACCVTVAA